MTKNRTLKLAIIAAGVAAALPAGAASVSVASGDLIMGVRATNGTDTTTYVISLGSISQYTSSSSLVTVGGSGSTINRGNIGADLAVIFGNNWATRTDLVWGLAAESSGDDLYASKAQSGATIPSPWSITSGTQRDIAAGNIENIIGIGITGGLDSSTATANSAFAAAQLANYQNGWRDYMGPGGKNGSAGATGSTDLGTFGDPGIEGGTNQSLALFHLVDGNGSTYSGTFTLGSDGVVSFSPVPEPSAALLIGGSLISFAFSRRRKNA